MCSGAWPATAHLTSWMIGQAHTSPLLRCPLKVLQGLQEGVGQEWGLSHA